MTKPKYNVTGAFLMCCSLVSLPQTAWSQEDDTPKLSWDGFGTLGVVYSDEDRADFVADRFAPEGAGHTDRWSVEVDSRLGLQLSAEITPRLSGVIQVVLEQRYDDTYKPSVEWANVAFDITSELSLRVGRVVLPTFLVSEYRKVGYANPWIRPPQEVYGVSPVTNTDGIDFSYQKRFRGFTNTLQIVYGQKDAKLPDGSEVHAHKIKTIANTLEKGAASFFVSYSRSRLSIDELDPLFNAFRAFGPAGVAIADRYDLDDKRSEILSVGARFDPGDWFAMAEWSRFKNRSFIGDSHGWYVTAGYRFGAVTPYLTLARNEIDSDTSVQGLDLPQAQALNAELQQLVNTAAEQKSVSVGARWDFARNLALKVQLDHIDLSSGSPGFLTNEQPDFRRGGSLSLFSAALDFVF